MTLLKNIFRTIWAIYCYLIIALVVIMSAIVVYITSLLFKDSAKKFNLKMCLHISSPAIMYLSGIWMKVYGRENIKPNTGYVIVSNHSSYMDIFANPTSVPFHCVFTYLAKAELGKTPVFRVIANNLAVLVDRRSLESRKKSYTYMKKVLNEGISVFLYPEGTRNKSDEPLLRFFDGAFKLAKDMQVPLVVSTLVGMKKINNTARLLDLRPGILKCYIEEPMDISEMNLKEVKEKVSSMMLKHLEEG